MSTCLQVEKINCSKSIEYHENLPHINKMSLTVNRLKLKLHFAINLKKINDSSCANDSLCIQDYSISSFCTNEHKQKYILD